MYYEQSYCVINCSIYKKSAHPTGELAEYYCSLPPAAYVWLGTKATAIGDSSALSTHSSPQTFMIHRLALTVRLIFGYSCMQNLLTYVTTNAEGT